ncbi:hypothetical protein AB0M12_10950 [Nocardia vinacea]|uniref:hypothetical protein n=1 Tax=Nocardia vinacea TaxID=96468 RepID=UPI003434D3DB
MSAPAIPAETPITVPPLPNSPLARFVWHCRHNPKRELWFAWWVTVIFYQLYTVAYFILSRTQPPPHPGWDADRVVRWFHDHHWGILIGFGLILLVTGMTAQQNALIAYSMRRMSVSRAFAYSYLVLYALAAIPGMVLMCIVLTVGAMRPDRDPELQYWLYDLGFLSFTGTMGVFLIGTLIWMIAILLDKNRVFPKWFAYLNLCNALTEIVVAPAWIFKRGVFAWNGAIAFWINVVVFGVYTVVFITLLEQLIKREDFGTGPLPDSVAEQHHAPTDPVRTSA